MSLPNNSNGEYEVDTPTGPLGYGRTLAKEPIGSYHALQVLVAMADDEELDSLEMTLDEEGHESACQALRAARAQVRADIEAYDSEEG